MGLPVLEVIKSSKPTNQAYKTADRYDSTLHSSIIIYIAHVLRIV